MAKLSIGLAPEGEDASVALDKHRKAFQLDHPDGSVMARHLEPKVRDFVNQGMGRSEAPTITPNTPTILACVPNYNQIYILWDIQLGLLNLDHYDIQVSEDDATWYSAVAGAKTGVLNAVTSIDNPNFSHTSIPFSGTSASPTGTKLYYRVRRVTQEAVEGSWSASANAMTVTLTTGDIAAGALTMDKFAATIRPPRVLSSLPTTPFTGYAQGDLVFLTTDNKLYRFTGSAWTVEVAAADIVASWLTAGAIAAGAIGTNELAAQSVTAEKIELDTITEDQISEATLTSKSLKFTDNVHENDDPLPAAGSKLLDCSMPSAKWSDGTEPKDGKSIVFEPWYIGSVLNPRIKTNFHGAIGTFSATTNRLTSPTDWTSYLDKSANTTSVNSFVNALGKTVSHVYTTAADNYIRKEYNQGSSVSGQTWTFSALIYSQIAQSIYLNLDDNWAYFGSEKKTLAAGLNYVSITGTATGLTGTVVHADISNFKMNTGSDNLGAIDIFVVESQLELNAFPTAFSLATRPASVLPYDWIWDAAFSIEGWIRPYFTYDNTTGTLRAVFGDGSGFFLAYYPAIGKWRVYIGGSSVKTSAYQHTDNTHLQQWIYFKVWRDVAAGTGGVYMKGSDATEIFNETWTGASTTAPANALYVGSLDATNYVFNGLFADIHYASSASSSTAHYTVGRPYYDESSLPCANFGARLSATGLDLYRGSIDIVDQYGREILISNRHGLKAKDACGNFLHDIPNGVILSDMSYGGHVFPLKTVTQLDTDVLNYTGTETSRDATNSTRNASLASFVGGNTNVRGIIVSPKVWLQLASAKRAANGFTQLQARYANVYNTTPPAYSGECSNVIVDKYRQIEVSGGADYACIEYGGDCLIPVVYNGTVPYITWNFHLFNGGMSASSGNYFGQIWLYIKALVM